MNNKRLRKEINYNEYSDDDTVSKKSNYKKNIDDDTEEEEYNDQYNEEKLSQALKKQLSITSFNDGELTNNDADIDKLDECIRSQGSQSNNQDIDELQSTDLEPTQSDTESLKREKLIRHFSKIDKIEKFGVENFNADFISKISGKYSI